MATRKNLPKIVTDIQDIVQQLRNEFESNKQPVTDDSQALHRLCAKLEFLLTSSLKEKGLFGGKKSYWHWMYNCLHRTKGLRDGLKFVQANKEVRTPSGKGRALIRYCLVHQTFADSLQNCVMNDTLRKQHLNENCVLCNQIHASALITSLYDLNAVNFDLNAKGYDLDSGWPTFASKTTTSGNDQWAIQSHVGSLGSLTSASIIMDTPQLHGSGSSVQSHVDQRVEELVLELDQSDVKIQEQQAVIAQLEGKAESLEKSTMEKEDILARVISDLETKNRHLHEAMSNMTSEFQAREQTWSEKTENLTRTKSEMTAKIKQLVSKVDQLEGDKHNLEELVSHNMSTITKNFAQGNYVKESTPAWISSSVAEDKETMKQISEENVQLRKELDRSQQACAKLEETLNKKSFEEAQMIEMRASLEDQEERTIEAMEKLKVDIRESTEQEILCKICKEANIDVLSPVQISDVLSHIASLARCETVQQDELQTSSIHDTTNQMINSLEDEKNFLMCDRDSALIEVGQVRQKWNDLQLELDNVKLKLESSTSESSRRIIELEEELSVKQEHVLTLQRQHAEMLGDLRVAQESLDEVKSNLGASREAYKNLEMQAKKKESEWNKDLEDLKMQADNEISEKDFLMNELKDRFHRLSSQNSDMDEQIQTEKTKCSDLKSELKLTNDALEAVTLKSEEIEEKLRSTETLLSSALTQTQEAETKNERLVANFLHDIREEKSKHNENIHEIFVGLEKCLQVLGVEDDVSEQISQEEIAENKFEKCNHLIERLFIHTQSMEGGREEEIALLKEQAEVDKMAAHDELLEEKMNFQSLNTETETLRLKLDVAQEEKMHNLDLIEKLQQEIIDLRATLDGSRVEVDETRVKVMEGSAREVELQDIITNQEIDIEHLKEKITQLLLDKDTLWKESESLKTRTSELEESLDEVNWVQDSDVTSCSSCDQQFSLTNRKHHCRMCGKIFCKSCSENWILKNNKRIRVCRDCVSNSCSLPANTSTDTTPDFATPNALAEVSSVGYEEIASEGIDETNVTSDSSFYQSLTDLITSTIGPTTEKALEQNNSVTVRVAARKESHIPVLLEKEGITLRWNISSDRDINFRMFYSQNQESNEQELVPTTRINSHIQAFTGQVVAQKPGVYTIVLDNTYSRMTAKEVTYKLDVVPS